MTNQMTNQEKKEALQRYRAAEREEARLGREIGRWRARAERMTAGYGPTPTGAGDGRSLERTVAHIDELTGRLIHQRDELVSLRLSLGEAIGGVADPRLRELLTLRYIEGMTWGKLAIVMGYDDLRWVYRLHGRALEQLTIESHD